MQYTLRSWRHFGTALYVAKTALMTVTVALAISCSALAANGIMLQIKDAPLKEVVMLLTQQSGANIVIADDSKLEKKVTASLNDIPLESALNHIVKSAGVSYRKMEDGTYIIGGTDVETPSTLSSIDLAKSLPSVEPVEVTAPKEKIITSIKLIHSRPSELLHVLLESAGMDAIVNSGNAYPTLDKKREKASNTSPAIYNPTTGTLTDFNTITNKNSSKNNQPVVPTIDPSAYNYGAGRTADQYNGAGQVGYPSGGNRPVGYTPGGYTGGYPGGYPGGRQSSTTGSTSSSSSNANFLWPEGIDNAVPFDLDNSIIVKGDEDGIEKFKKIIRMLDIPPKQVQIKVEMVEVSTSDTKKFGIDWSLQRLNETFNSSFTGDSGNVIVGVTAGNLTADLRAQLTQTIGKVINSPIISTINNQLAYIDISDSIPYWETTQTVVDNQILNDSNTQWMDIDSYLKVQPRINGDNTITMILNPEVSDTGDMYTGPDGEQIPEERSQELLTQRRVADGETIVVGGFIRKNDSKTTNKVPILADLPIVGTLFRSTSITTDDRELLIFVTPTIIPDSTSGTMGASLVP